MNHNHRRLKPGLLTRVRLPWYGVQALACEALDGPDAIGKLPAPRPVRMHRRLKPGLLTRVRLPWYGVQALACEALDGPDAIGKLPAPLPVRMHRRLKPGLHTRAVLGRVFLVVLLLIVGFLAASILATVAAEPERGAPRWWKGNLHTHSLWSDGDDFPEMIAGWYKERGYHFLGISDHNIMHQGDKWIAITNAGRVAALAKYQEQFGRDWVESRERNGQTQVRLKNLEEYRGRFETPGRFLLIPSEEITDRHLTAPVHINATNLRELIRPRGGSNVIDVMQNNVDAVFDQRRRTGQPMFPHLNHPNFGWGVTAEELMRVRGERFFEVYNGHPYVHNEGDATHASTDRIWDIVLTWRLAFLNLEPMFGLGVDDSHHYHQQGPKQSNPGRAWVMVRTPRLSPESIIAAMEAGDFYASSGVRLREIRAESNRLRLEIETEPGITYTTQFIGTRKEFDPSNTPIRTAGGEALRVTHRYSDDVGAVLAEVTGPKPEYRFRGDELYVRAKIISSKPQTNPYREGATETAWTQPVVR